MIKEKPQEFCISPLNNRTSKLSCIKSSKLHLNNVSLNFRIPKFRIWLNRNRNIMKDLSSDNKYFIERLTEIITANITSDNFGVSELAQEMGKSRSYIHRRLKKLTNHSISHFIRVVRLEKALQLLRNNNFTAAEVSYKVGFGSPSYFNSCFHSYFGFPPGEAKKQKIKTPKYAGKTKLSKTHDKLDWTKAHLKILIIASGSVFLILLSYFFYDVFFSNKSLSDDNSKSNSIVVMPFKNLSLEKENEYFATGVTEDILNNLSLISNMKVVSRTLAEFYHEYHLPTRELAKELNVNYVLEGSIRRQKNKVRLSVQLIDARADEYIWSKNYDRTLTDIFAIQSDIAQNVARELKTVLTSEEKLRIEKIPTQSNKAYNYFLLGRYFTQKRTQADMENSIRYFNKAIHEDSVYAKAWAGLANAIFLQSFWRWEKWTERFDEAKEIANRALELDPDLAEAYAVLGCLNCYADWEWEKSGIMLQKAVNLNPNYALAHQYYSELLEILNKEEKARREINKAIELDPVFFMHRSVSSDNYYRAKKYDKALEERLKMVEINPQFKTNKLGFFLTYLHKDNHFNAVKALQKVIQSEPSKTIYANDVKNIYQESGIDSLLIWLTNLEKKRSPTDDYLIARLYALQQDKINALLWLEKAMEKKVANLPRIAINPDFEILRQEPRFIALIDSMHLIPYHPWAN